MEEILASIRRIIADDQEGGKAAPTAALQEPARAAAPAPRPEPEILDLAEIATPIPARGPSLDLEQDDIGYRHASEMDFEALQIEEEPPAPPPRPVTAFVPEPVFTPEPASTDEPPRERLTSSATDTNVGSSFNMLAHTVLTHNARTLEDLVKDMLKPMLKTWLDDNLPVLVERLVRAEIERVTRGR
jgi:cell pole-organizing protein PopZ